MKQDRSTLDRRIRILMAAVAAFTGLSNAGIIVTRGHIVGGSATGTLVAIDSPFISNANGTAITGGPSWETGGAIFANQADQGFAAPSSPSDDGLREFDLNGTPWEPDGTPFSQARGYFIYPDGPSPGTTWTFNLATSGIDLPDGTIIHGVYARFGGRNGDKARYEFTESVSGDLVVDQNSISSAGDLVLRWFDSDGNPRDSNFQRIFPGQIEVTGGDGFQLRITDTTVGFAGHIDAIVLDTSLPKANDVPAISTRLPVDDKTGVVPWTSLEVTFDEPIALTGTGTVTITDLTDGSSTQVVAMSGPRVTQPSGERLVIAPAMRLEFGTNYSVQISADALKDLATTPNNFPGILDHTTWNFSTRAVPDQLHNVLIVTCALADEQPSATTDRATNLLFHDPLNVDEAMRASSYGQIGLNLGDNSGLPATVQLSYPETVAHQKANGGSTGLRNRMASSLAALGYTLANFRFIIYIQPQSMSSGAAGWANLGGNSAVFLSPIYMRLAMHEMGHCLGGNHSSGSDLGCSLGGADVDYNASKKIHYGWLNAFPGTVVNLPANTGTALSLAPLSRSPASMTGVRAVRVPNPNGGTSTYLVSYKINDGPYNTLQNSSYAQKVHVTEDAGGSLTTHRATLGEKEVYVVGKLRVICTSVAALSADVTIAVGNPILLSIADNVSAGPVTVGQSVNFTVTFDEAIDAATVDILDFENGGTAGITVNSVSATDNPAVFTVSITTDSPGNLNLRIKDGAVIRDQESSLLDSSLLITSLPLPDDTTIAVNALAAPTLVSITDDAAGIPLSVGQAVVYTVTFSEAIKAATLTADDFENGSSAGISIGVVSEVNPSVFTVPVTTTSAGILTLQIKAGAVVEDRDGSVLGTGSALPDGNSLSVKSSSAPLLLSFVDNVGGGPVIEGDPVTFTVTFDEAMNAATLGTDDFENGSSADISVESVTATTNPAVFTVAITTEFRGDLVLQIKAAATIQDPAGFPLNTSAALPDDTTIAVNASPPPTLLSIADNVTGGPITAGSLVNFTVTFDKAINASTLGIDDFENGSSATTTLDRVTVTANPTIFTVAVTPTSSGDLNLRIKAGAVIEDIYGLLLDTTTALVDNTTITVFAAPASLYWDDNGNTAGAESTPTGIWGTDPNWNTDSTGANGGAFQTLTPNADNLSFVAAAGASSGSNVTIISVSGTQVANSLNFQHSGAFTLSGGTSITLGNGGVGSGGITRNQFAFDSTAQAATTISTAIILNNSQTWTNNAASTLTIQGGLNNGGNTLTIDNTGTVNFGSVTPIITGAGGLTKNGPGRLLLGAAAPVPAHNYAGTTTLNGGVTLVSSYNFGPGNLTLNGGVIESYWQEAFVRPLGSGNGAVQLIGGASGFGNNNGNSNVKFGNSANNEAVWGVKNEAGNTDATGFFNPSTLVLQTQYSQGAKTLTFENMIDLNGTTRTIQANSGAAGTSISTISGVIRNTRASAAGLIKTGAGLLNLNGINTYNGGTTIQAGTLQLGSAFALGSTSGPLTVNGGLLNLNDQTIAVGNLTGTGGTIANNAGNVRTLTIGTGNGTGGNYQGVIANKTGTTAGAVSLTKTGSGTITLSGLNTYSGATIINGGGTLILTGASQATSAITFADTSSLGLVIGSPVTASGAAVNFTNGRVSVTGTPSASSHVLLTASSLTGTPVLAAAVPGYQLAVVGNQLLLNQVDPYATWAGGALFGDDANGDGSSNGLAFLLGASGPNVSALGRLPTVTENGRNLVLEFDCLAAAERGTAVLILQHSSDLGISDVWASARVPGAVGNTTVNHVDFVVTDPGAPGGPLRVVATVQASQASLGRLFGRLQATK